MRNLLPLALPLLAGPVLAQFQQLPNPNLVQRTTPRATWSAIVTSGTVQIGIEHRADTPGAATNDKLYVFGGCQNNNTSATLNDLWQFDALTGLFSLVNNGTVAPTPHARGRCAVAWNPVTGRLIVFGGDNRATGPLPPDTMLGDTWQWDPGTNTWTDVTPAISPSPRRWASLTYEPTTGGMLLFGGDTGGGTVSDETWLFIGGTWAQLSPATVPPARRGATLVTRTDPEFNDVLMCCGDDSSATTYAPDVYRHLDVWTWNGADWTLISDYDWATQTGTFPAGAFANQGVYDPLRRRVVVQSGQGIAANTANNTVYNFGTSVYNGSPTNYTSEFDCDTNTWVLYASGSLTVSAPYNNLDPAIGRISRYSAGFIPATGKVYKAVGQNGGNGLGSGTTGARPTYNVFEYQADPIASATSYGAGCAGPGGALTLAATSLPWTDRTWSASCTGLGSSSIALTVWGPNQASTPLQPLLPIAGAGCLALNDAILLASPSFVVGGQYDIDLPIADAASLSGTVLNVQVVELELDAAFNLSGLYTSNGVAITVGAL